MYTKECSFRDMWHKVCFIECADQIHNLKNVFKVAKEDNGVLALGYIDHESGFTFEVLATACYRDGIISRGTGNSETSMKFRKSSVNDREIHIFEDIKDFRDFDEKMQMIDNFFGYSDDIAKARNVEAIDCCRHSDFPDDVLCYITKAGLEIEGVWLRCEGVGESSLKGKLLVEPKQDFGIHNGDMVEFKAGKNGDEIVCIAEIKN